MVSLAKLPLNASFLTNKLSRVHWTEAGWRITWRHLRDPDLVRGCGTSRAGHSCRSFCRAQVLSQVCSAQPWLAAAGSDSWSLKAERWLSSTVRRRRCCCCCCCCCCACCCWPRGGCWCLSFDARGLWVWAASRACCWSSEAGSVPETKALSFILIWKYYDWPTVLFDLHENGAEYKDVVWV